ncbi:DUF72 domain-containing protein [Enterococcus sp. LJL120]
MIRIGLTRFDEHINLTGKPKASLFEYAGHLPLVELDTAYYAIPKETTVANWLTQVPPSFRFIIKMYGGLTKQNREDKYFSSEEAMAEAYLTALKPLVDSKQLFYFLCQFPSFFDCTSENVAYLQKLRHLLPNVPLAIEFRSESWYQENVLNSMRKFMQENQFSLVIIDEPQVANRSVPFDDFVTNPDFTMFRFHGRNVPGWQENGADWQQKRTLYDYNGAEIKQLAASIRQTAKASREVAVIFNNNSGGHAAGNALMMVKELGLDYQGLNPKQLDLF